MVNIIIPTFKAKDTLKQCLKSLENQTKKMFLVTIVQDCDGEDYSKILNDIKLPINLIQLEENFGAGVARQTGIDITPTNCEYIMFIDADDLLQPRAVEVLTSEIKKRNADLISSTIIRANLDHTSDTISGTNSTWCHGKIYSKKYLIDNNIRFLPELRGNEDCYFNLLVNHLTENKYYVKEPLYIWKQNKNSITSNNFTKEYGSHFIKGVSLGCLRILKEYPEKDNSIFLLNETATFYKQWQGIKALGGDTNFCVNELKDFLTNEKVLKALKSKNNILALMNKIEIGNIYDKKIIFYKQNFDEWFLELTNIDLREYIKDII